MGTWPGLDLDEDLAYQKNAWRAEKVGWCVLGILCASALLGFLGGGGLFSEATVRASGPTSQGSEIIARYPRFTRLKTMEILEFQIPNQTAAQPFKIWLGQGILDGILIHRILPRPSSEVVREGGVEFHFPMGGGEAHVIQFQIESRRPGRVSGQVKFNDASGLSLWQFVYP